MDILNLVHTDAFRSLTSLFRGNVDAEIQAFSKENPVIRSDHLAFHRLFDAAAQIQVDLAEPLKAIELYVAGEHYASAKCVILKELWLLTPFNSKFSHLATSVLDAAETIRSRFTRIELDEVGVASSLKSTFLSKNFHR